MFQIDLSQFKLQLWPGFETTIQNYRNDILVNCDVIHKAMRTDTVYSIMKEVFAKDRNNFQNTFKQEILGKTVLTDYNNQTYCIDDIDFDINPDTTFKKGDRDISIRDYYAEVYYFLFFFAEANSINLFFFFTIYAEISKRNS